MADLSKMTTEQLKAMLQQPQQAEQPPAQPAGGDIDLSQLSDEELQALRQQQPHDWSELPGNIVPSAKQAGEGLIQSVTHPIETFQGIASVAQGGVDRLLPEGVTDFLDTHVSGLGRARTAEEKERDRKASGDFGQRIVDRWGSLEKAKNTLITDPVGGALEVGSVAIPALRRGITPMPASPAIRAAGKVLKKEGVPLTAGQRTGSKGLQYAEQELGGGATRRVMDKQGEKFTQASLKRAGVKADRVDSDVWNKRLQRFDQEFGSLAQRNKLIPDAQLDTDLHGAVSNYFQNVNASNRVPRVANLARDIVNSTRGPRGPVRVSGERYNSWRSDLEQLARENAGDPQLQKAYRAMRQALDEAMDRSIAATNPADHGLWRKVRNEYKNFLINEGAATRATDKADQGLITPGALRGEVLAAEGDRRFLRGKGDLTKLAKTGGAVMRELPQSGTTPRAVAHAVGAGVGALLGAPGGIIGSGGMAGIGALVGPTIAGRVLMNPLVQKYLGNQILGRAGRGSRATAATAQATALANAEERRRAAAIRMLER